MQSPWLYPAIAPPIPYSISYGFSAPQVSIMISMVLRDVWSGQLRWLKQWKG